MTFASKIALAALAAGASCFVAPAAFAYDDDIVVTAPERVVVGRSHETGAPIERISVSRIVDARDLDLRYARDNAELNRRVSVAARDACRELDERYPTAMFPPNDGSTRASCHKDAVRSAHANYNY